MSETYLTKDTGEAAYLLASGVRLAGLVRSDDGSYVFFSFANPTLCKEMKREYYLGLGNVRPQVMMKSYWYLVRRAKENSIETRS